MKAPVNESEREILEVERRLISRVERVGDTWQELRTSTVRKYAVPALITAVAVGALIVIAASGKRRMPPKAAAAMKDTTLMAKLLAAASLISTLRRLPVGPLLGPVLEWARARRRLAYINSRTSPISTPRRNI
mgnify:CR=1 FL=1